MGDKENALSPGDMNEEKQEYDNVWADLLKGEETQRVKDLRYSTMHAERKSNEYEYVGPTLKANKRTDLFEYKGKVDKVDGEKIILVQDNNRTTAQKLNEGENKDFIIKFIYDFMPKFNLSSYVNKLVVKNGVNGENIIDFYFSKYLERFNNVHRFFLAELERVMKGDRRSQMLEATAVRFDAFHAFGENDGVTCLVNGLKFIGTSEYDGSYILRFSYKNIIKDDFIDKVYDKEAERKYKAKEKRQGFIHNVGYDINKKAKEDSDALYFGKAEGILNNE